jgi:hypothetical protein
MGGARLLRLSPDGATQSAILTALGLGSNRQHNSSTGLLAGRNSRKMTKRHNDERGRSMTITLPLEPQEEARLKAAARARGLSPDAFVREALDKILAEAPAQPVNPKKSAYGLLAKYGPGPTEEEIDENRREMFRGFGEDLP